MFPFGGNVVKSSPEFIVALELWGTEASPDSLLEPSVKCSGILPASIRA